MKVTIKDISAKTGLSASTISRVLSGHGYVKEQTRQLVEEAARELGYNLARNQKRGDFGRVVLALVDDITNLFYADILRGLDDALSAAGYRLFICNSEGSTQKEEESIAFADANELFGVVMITVTETETLVSLMDNISIPVIMVNRYLRSRDCDAVCIDNYRGGYLATQYLLDMGHTRIAHLSGPQKSSASYDRLRGFRDALSDRGIAFDPSMVYEGNLRREKGFEYAEHFVAQDLDFSAVFCGNDIMARAFIDRLSALNVRVPEQVSVIAFDETQDAVRGNIGITNVSKNPYDMGNATANILFDRVNNPENDVRKVIFSPQLNERESVVCRKR